jgi:hypothetical protein
MTDPIDPGDFVEEIKRRGTDPHPLCICVNGELELFGTPDPLCRAKQHNQRGAPESTPQDGAALIAAERQRQVGVEGWTPEHDDKYTRDQLLSAARNYMEIGSFIAMTGRTDGETFYRGMPPEAGLWPWTGEWWKPDYTDAVRNLVKAGALIAAEIDRIQRTRDGK